MRLPTIGSIGDEQTGGRWKEGLRLRDGIDTTAGRVV